MYSKSLRKLIHIGGTRQLRGLTFPPQAKKEEGKTMFFKKKLVPKISVTVPCF